MPRAWPSFGVRSGSAGDADYDIALIARHGATALNLFTGPGEQIPPSWQSVAGDANADGYINDPIYVPADARIGGDVSLVVDDGQGGVAPAPAGTYDDLAAYVRSQRCLWTQRGRLVARNSCRNPWRSETEARLARTFPAGRRSVTLTVDVFNLLNLFSARWGKVRSLNDAQILRLAGHDAAQGRGIYQFQPPDRRQVDVQASRWRMQIGATVSF